MLFDMVAVQIKDVMKFAPKRIAEALCLFACFFFLLSKANNRLYCCFLLQLLLPICQRTLRLPLKGNLHYILSLSGNGGCGGE
jgi:hypothetical protein